MKKSDVEKSIDELSGNISAVARKHHKCRPWMYEFIKNNGLWPMVEDAREKMLDNVESALYQQALSGNTVAMIFFLKTQGKKRGWVERQELTGADGEAMKHTISFTEIINGSEND